MRVSAENAEVVAGMADDDRSGEAAEPLDTFARRLNFLFQTVHPRGRRPFSNEHVAEALGREQGIDISANYIWMLRSGRRDNPRVRHVEGLARFFGVPPGFLLDTEEAERVRTQLSAFAELADNGTSHLALRAASVDERTLEAIHSLLAQVQDLTSTLRPATPQPPTGPPPPAETRGTDTGATGAGEGSGAARVGDTGDSMGEEPKR